MSNSLWFSRIFTLQSFSWFCFNFFWLFLRCTWKKITTRVRNFFITIEFENFQNFNFSFFHFKFIHFKITTYSFIYSIAEQFFETHFHKNNYRGILLGYTRQNFQVYIPPYLGCGGILYEQHSLNKFIALILKFENNYLLTI